MLSENSKAAFILLAASLFAVYCFVFGQSGVLERMRYQKEKLLLQNEIQLLQKENVRLKSLLTDYSSGRLALSECEAAGYVSPGSKVYNFINAPVKPVEKEKRKRAQLFSIEHLRIAWITLSGLALAVFYLLVRRQKRNDRSDSLRGIDETGN